MAEQLTRAQVEQMLGGDVDAIFHTKFGMTTHPLQKKVSKLIVGEFLLISFEDLTRWKMKPNSVATRLSGWTMGANKYGPSSLIMGRRFRTKSIPQGVLVERLS